MLGSFLTLSLLASAPAPTAIAAIPEPMVQEEGSILITAERVIVRPGEERENVSVLVQEGRIVAIGEGLSAPEGARSLSAKVVCAGFVDPWTTLGLDSSSSGDLGTNPASRTVDGLDAWADRERRLEALRGGVTSSRVQAGSRAVMGGIGALVRNDASALQAGADGVVLSDACVSASVGITRNRRADIFDRASETDRLAGLIEAGRRYREDAIEYRYELEEWEKKIAEEAAELEKDFKKAKKARDKKKKDAEEDGKEFKEKKYKEDKKPKKPKFDATKAAMARVAEGELPLVVEVHRIEEIRNLLAATEKFDRLRLVIAGATEAGSMGEELAERGIPVILWPTLMGENRRDEHDQHDPSLAGQLSEAGVTVLIGSGGGRDVRELRLLAALAVGRGMAPEKALAAITSLPAKVFDAGSRIGTVESGREADLLLLDGDPLATTTHIQYVLSNGRVVVEQ